MLKSWEKMREEQQISTQDKRAMRDFFQDYTDHPDVAAKDKARLLRGVAKCIGSSMMYGALAAGSLATANHFMFKALAARGGVVPSKLFVNLGTALIFINTTGSCFDPSDCTKVELRENAHQPYLKPMIRKFQQTSPNSILLRDLNLVRPIPDEPEASTISISSNKPQASASEIWSGFNGPRESMLYSSPDGRTKAYYSETGDSILRPKPAGSASQWKPSEKSVRWDDDQGDNDLGEVPHQPIWNGPAGHSNTESAFDVEREGYEDDKGVRDSRVSQIQLLEAHSDKPRSWEEIRAANRAKK